MDQQRLYILRLKLSEAEVVANGICSKCGLMRRYCTHDLDKLDVNVAIQGWNALINDASTPD